MGIYYNQSHDTLPANHFCDIEGFPVIGKWSGDDKLFTYEGYELGWPAHWRYFGRRWYEVLMNGYYLSSDWAWVWWDVKLAAAINLATNECGISKEDLLKEPLLRFHVYYTVAACMFITKTPIPGQTSFVVFDKMTDKKLWNNYLHEIGVSPDGASYAREVDTNRESAGPVGLYWDKKYKAYYWLDKTQNKKRIYFNERYHEIKSYDYSKRVQKKLGGFASGIATWFNKNIAHKEHVLGNRWYTDTYSYVNMKSNMWFSNQEWNAIIKDLPGNGITDVGKLLINKSLMVYTYSMYAGLASPHHGNLQIVKQQFYSNVNAFIHDEKNMASRDLIWYYDKAIKALHEFDHVLPGKWYDPGIKDPALIKVPVFIMKPPVVPVSKHLISNNNFKPPPREEITEDQKVVNKDNKVTKKEPKLYKETHKKENHVERVKMKEPKKEIKVGTDLMILAGVSIAGIAVYIWQR